MNGIKLAITTASVCGVTFVASATDYYLNSSPAQNVALNNAAYWSEGSPSGTPGDEGVPIDTSGNYFVTGNRMFRVKDSVFTGASLTIGSEEENKWDSRICHDSWDMGYNGIRCVRGYYLFNVSSTSIYQFKCKIDSPVEILSAAETPFGFKSNGGYNNHIFEITGAFTGNSGTGVYIGANHDPMDKQGPTLIAPQTNITFSICDATGYHGKFTVFSTEGVDFGYGLSLGAGTVPATVEMMPATRLSTRSANEDVTIANLTLHGGSALKTSYDVAQGTNGVITVSDAFSKTDGKVEVIVDNAPSATGNEAIVLPVLRVPFAAALDESDFKIATADSYSAQGVLRVVADEAAGVRTLCVIYRPVIQMTGDDSNSVQSDTDMYPSSMTNGVNWSDSLAPHSNAAYQVIWHDLRTPHGRDVDFDFPGDELWFSTYRASKLILCCRTLYVGRLLWDTTHASSLLSLVCGMSTTLQGRFTLNATLAVSQYANSVFTVESEIDGPGGWKMTGYIGTGVPSATTVFAGMNTNWTGSITFDQAARHDATYDFPNFNQRQILKFSDGRNLGGKLAAFNAGALTLKGYTEVIPTAPATLAAEMNRGISVVDAAQFNIAEGCDLRCEWPITLGGTLYKFGVGTLALGGSGLVVPAGGEGNRIVVSNGYVKAVSSDAFNGATLDFAANRPTGLKVDFVQNDVSLRRYGLKNVATETPFAGTVNVSFDGVTDAAFVPGTEIKVGICTVQTKVADDVAKLLKVTRPKHPMWRAQVVREDDPETGWTTFSLLDKESGLLMILK